MEDSRRMRFTRIDKLPIDVILDLCMEDRDPQEYELGTPDSESLGLLPGEMTIEEISTLGVRASSIVERVNGSYDGYSNGRKIESRMTRRIGFYAVSERDWVTASSVAEHLKWLGGIRNRAAAFIINRELKHKPLELTNA